MEITLAEFDKGLWLSSPKDKMPAGTVRRNRGSHSISMGSLRSRAGSTLIQAENAHSIAYFNSKIYTGVSTELRETGVAIKTGLSGNRLTFTKMPPTAGVKDQLFITGGGELCKVDEDSVVSGWGIIPPSEAPILAVGAAGNLNATYKYKLTYYNSSTGTRSNPSPDVGDSLKFVLHFDNNVTDATGNHTFTNNNACTFDAVNEKFGTHCIEMDGVNQYISAPTHADFAMGTEDFTIHFWMYITDNTVNGVIFQMYSSSSNSVYLEMIGTGYGGSSELIFVLRVDGSFKVMLTKVWVGGIDENTWFHVAVTRNSNIWSLYIDGMSIEQQAYTGSWPDFGVSLETRGVATYFKGKLDEFVWCKGAALWTTDFTPPTAATGVDGSVAPANQAVSITGIPTSSDSQVDQVEIWRTLANGSIFFRLTSISNGTAAYTDDTVDADLEDTELPLDNIKPYSWFDDCVFHNASSFWITRTQSGERGRVYYSPIGRSEAVQSFINVSNDDDGCQRLFSFQGMLGVITKDTIYQIQGENPYKPVKISGTRGTDTPFTIIETPVGPFYEGYNGVRFLYGTDSPIVNKGSVDRIFRGESVANLTSFSGICSAYGREEYIISDGTQTLACDVRTGRWRDVGVGLNALTYEKSIASFIATLNSTHVVYLEQETATDDNGTAISIDWETATARISKSVQSIIQFIHIDMNANSQLITVSAFIDDAELTLGKIQGTSRSTTTFAVNKGAFTISIRLSGSITAPIELFNIILDLEGDDIANIGEAA